MASVELKSVSKQYDAGPEVIKNVSLQVKDGEFMVFVGPSGCGKSTLMRMIAGLEDLSGGELHIADERVDLLPPAQRGVAMVFQSYALYPHMTVAENMGFALKLAGHSKSEIRTAVNRAADVLQIGPLLERKPKALSGGQRQRVAIGRAIVRQPKVFLFDEPLSNLDAALRGQMRIELRRLHRELGTTMIYVTHDQTEAMTLGDRIAVFNQGRIEQVGVPMALYQRPGNRFVAGFLGSPAMNFLPGTLKLPGLPLAAPADTWGVRPESWDVIHAGPGLAAVVELAEHLGDVTLLHTRLTAPEAQGASVTVKLADLSQRIATGSTLQLRPRVEETHLFDSRGQSVQPSVRQAA